MYLHRARDEVDAQQRIEERGSRGEGVYEPVLVSLFFLAVFGLDKSFHVLMSSRGGSDLHPDYI